MYNAWKRITLVCLALLVMVCTATQAAKGPTRIAFATHLQGGGVDEAAMAKFKEIVERISNRQIVVDLYVGGVLGNETDLWELLAVNEVQMNMCGEIVIPSFAPGTYVFGVPFLYEDGKAVAEALEGPLGSSIRQQILDNGKMRVLGFGLRAPRILTSNRPIRSVSDLKGLKLRMPPTPEWIETWRELGADVVALAGSELFGALQTGLVDAQDNPASVSLSSKYYEVQKYIARTNHLVGFRTWLISEAFYKSLTSQEEEWVSTAAAEAIDYYTRTEREAEEENIKELQNRGMIVVDVDVASFRQKIGPAVQKLRKNWDEAVYMKYVEPYLSK